MNNNIEYKKDTAFVNRKKELLFLEKYLSERPENILFLYGPKSSGKTTLLYKFLEQIQIKEKVEIKFLNLRQVSINTYKEFLNVFFTVENKLSKIKKYLAEASAGIFRIDEELAKKLAIVQADPFVVMRNQLQELTKKGFKTIIIIDELQELQDIYINKEREVIKELFNFFVSMTKELHLAHIIVSSSDGYFIDQVYNDSKLKKTSKFYEIDYLPKSDVVDWLTNLKKYSKINDYTLTDEEIEIFWDNVGGSVWEIQYLLSDRFDNDTKTICEKYSELKTSEIDIYIKMNDLKKEILKLFTNQTFNKYVDIKNISADEEEVEKYLTEMVHKNIVYFNPVTATFSPQSRSTELGIKNYFDNLKKNGFD